MSRGVRRRVAAAAVAAALMTGGAAGAASGAVMDDPVFAFDTPSVTVEYGQYWYVQATAHNAPGPMFWQATEATLTGAPSGYAADFGSYKVDEQTVVAYINPQLGTRPLTPGTYTTSITIGDQEGGGALRVTTAPGTLTVQPAPLGIDLKIGPDPSNAANAIVSARFTGAFVDNYFSSADPQSGLSPAGAWAITVTDADGQTVHEFSQDREAGDDVLAVSSYWSDVPPGDYSANATFTPTGDSAENFTVTQPAPAAFASAAAPGGTSTATPAPPTAPESESVGMTLPAWIPVVAGVLTAGLIALMVVQIVRLRRIGRTPSVTGEVAA